ncbi:MAG TPA: hypothetical protein VF756_28315 [Thermoanaerobaculia bacterium]
MPRRIIPTALTLSLLFAASLSADVLLTKRRDADEFMFRGPGTPGAKNQKVEIWIGSDRVRRDDGRTALILRLDQKRLYFINHGDRTWSATDLRQKGDRWRATATYVAGPTENVWRWHAKTEPVGETRQVGSWQATRHRVALSSETGTAERIRLDWWVAPDLKVDDAPLRTLMLLLASFSSAGEEWLATVLALPGAPVLYERVEKQPEVDVKVREELVSVREGEAPAGTYELPAGYRGIDLGEYRETYGWPAPL